MIMANTHAEALVDSRRTPAGLTDSHIQVQAFLRYVILFQGFAARAAGG